MKANLLKLLSVSCLVFASFVFTTTGSTRATGTGSLKTKTAEEGEVKLMKLEN